VRLELVLVATATTQFARLYLTPFRQDPLMDAVRCGIDFLGCTLFIPRVSGGKREAVEFTELIQMFSHWRQNRADGLLAKENGPAGSMKWIQLWSAGWRCLALCHK
jgi:hypothetical protein